MILILRNLQISFQFEDSQIALCNLQIAQIPRLRGTYTLDAYNYVIIVHIRMEVYNIILCRIHNVEFTVLCTSISGVCDSTRVCMKYCVASGLWINIPLQLQSMKLEGPSTCKQ